MLRYRWQDHAACADLDPSEAARVFFPEGDGEENDERKQWEATLRKWDQARAICGSCPVATECLNANLEEKWGMFGGTTPSRRKRIRAQRGLLCRTCGRRFHYDGRGRPKYCSRPCNPDRHRRVVSRGAPVQYGTGIRSDYVIERDKRSQAAAAMYQHVEDRRESLIVREDR